MLERIELLLLCMDEAVDSGCVQPVQCSCLGCFSTPGASALLFLHRVVFETDPAAVEERVLMEGAVPEVWRKAESHVHSQHMPTAPSLCFSAGHVFLQRDDCEIGSGGGAGCPVTEPEVAGARLMEVPCCGTKAAQFRPY